MVKYVLLCSHFIDKKCIRTCSSPKRVRSESATYSRSADSISFSYIPIASQCISLLKPIDAPRLWGWTEEWAGLDSGLLRDDWRVCRKTASPFDWQRYYKKSLMLKLFESHRGFCKCSRNTNCCNLFLGICLAKLLGNFHHTFHMIIHHSLFQFNLIHTFPPSLISLFRSFVHLFIHSYSRLENFLKEEGRAEFTYK